MIELNLNQKLYIDVSTLKNGTNDMRVKIGRSYYFVRISKDSNSSIITVKKKVKDKNLTYKKQLGYAFIKNTALIDKEFILNIETIENIQYSFNKYKNQLYY